MGRIGVLILPLALMPGLASAAEPAIVHDPAAAEELTVAFAKLWAAPSFRRRWVDVEPDPGEPQIVEYQGRDRMRMTQKDSVGEWEGTTETVSVPGRMAYRFVSPALDAHLAKLKAKERAATLLNIAGTLRQMFQALAMGGPLGIAAAAQSGALLVRGAGALSATSDLELYGNWQCLEVANQIAAAPAGAPAPGEQVERLPSDTIDGEPVRGYRSVVVTGEATLVYRSWVLEASGMPRRSEMEMDMPMPAGAPPLRTKSVMDFYDFGAPITVELPPCSARD